jgi:hypothetical protein
MMPTNLQINLSTVAEFGENSAQERPTFLRNNCGKIPYLAGEIVSSP